MEKDSQIARVETIPLRMPFAAPFTMATPTERTRESIDILIVRITTRGGVVGIGETQAWRRQGSSEVLLNLVRVIEELFAPRLVGRSCMEIAQILHDLDGVVYNSLYAQAAVGDALYDAKARLLGIPVSTLLGGRNRDEIPVGFALGISGSPDELVAKAEEVHALGYRHLRLKMGIDPVADVRNAAAMRKRFGDAIMLRGDINGALTFPDALRLLARLVPFDLDLVEQPVAASDLDGMSDLAARFPTPICADESLSTARSLLEIVRRRAASAVQLKIGKNGGIHHCQRLWTIAEAAGISVFPGNHPCTSISTAAMAHLCASRPALTLVGDFQAGVCDILGADVASAPIVVQNAKVRVPEGPGLGITLDDQALARYRLQ